MVFPVLIRLLLAHISQYPTTTARFISTRRGSSQWESWLIAPLSLIPKSVVSLIPCPYPELLSAHFTSAPDEHPKCSNKNERSCGTVIGIAWAPVLTTISAGCSKHYIAVAATFTEEQCLVSILRICLVGKSKGLVNLGRVITYSILESAFIPKHHA